MFLLAACLLYGISIVSAEPVSEPSLLALMQDVKSAIRQAQARYDSGNVTGAANLARKILAKYPGNADAKAILDQCIATEREEYEKAVGSMSVAELTNFQKKYPESEYGIDVSKRIADLPLWLDAKKKNTLDSYKQYLSESSHQIYKSDADYAIAELTVKQAYDAAVAVNTIKALEQFRRKYPNSAYDKQASNKIARIMADKFNSRSTYTDKINALVYAKNEMTRDYVNNKFNKATEKNSYTSSSSSSKYSDNSGRSSSNSATRSTSNAYSSSNGHVKKKSIVNFGIQGSFELGNLYQTYPSYLGGLGVEMRVGATNNPINLIIGAKMGWASYEYSYEDRHYYGSKSWDYYYVTVSNAAKTTNFLIPVIVHWNFVKSNWAALYLGTGYQLGIPLESSNLYGQQSHAMILDTGFGFRHFDMRFYYIKYFKSLFNDPKAINPILGISMTYFF